MLLGVAGTEVGGWVGGLLVGGLWVGCGWVGLWVGCGWVGGWVGCGWVGGWVGGWVCSRGQAVQHLQASTCPVFVMPDALMQEPVMLDDVEKNWGTDHPL